LGREKNILAIHLVSLLYKRNLISLSDFNDIFTTGSELEVRGLLELLCFGGEIDDSEMTNFRTPIGLDKTNSIISKSILRY